MTDKKDNNPDQLTRGHMNELGVKLYNHIMRRLDEEEPNAAVLQVGYKMITDSKLNLEDGSVVLDTLMEDLPDEFKKSMKSGWED